MENRRLMVNTDCCTGCGFCALVCAVHHCGQWDPVLGRIKPRSYKNRNLESAVTCAHCQEAPCVSACLMNVIYQDQESQLVLRNLDACIGCRVCEISCPFGAGTYDYIREKVVNCDLCGGSPVCVEYCPAGALSFTDIYQDVDRRRQKQLEQDPEFRLRLEEPHPKEGR